MPSAWAVGDGNRQQKSECNVASNFNGRNVRSPVMWTIYSLMLLKLTVALIPAIHGYDSSDSSASMEETVIRHDNHLNNTHYKTLSEKQIVGMHRRVSYDGDDLKATYSADPRFDKHPFHCSACQFRSVFAKASLKSIKAHVLLKLGFEYPPNQTNYPKVPDDILRSFNEKISHSQQSRMREAGDQQFMGDDPNVHDQPDEMDEDFDYYQITNKIYILPNQTLPRRLQKDNKEYLQFRLDERDYSNDFVARMHVYVYGEDWVRTHQPYSPENVVNFTISKAIKPSITPEVGRYVGQVPKGPGRFIEFNVTDMVQEWFENPLVNKYVLVETFNAFSEQIVADDPNGGKFVSYWFILYILFYCSADERLCAGRVANILQTFDHIVVIRTTPKIQLFDLAWNLSFPFISVKYIMKCDDDTFVNVPNLLQVLLGGTVPVYRASIPFYDKNTIDVKSSKNRLAEVKRLLTGFLFCEAKPIGDTSSKWYSPNYMYNKEFYPDYLSGTAYLMNLNAAKLLYRTSLTTPIFHLEDVYLTGIVADRVKLRRYHHPLFFYSTTKDLCSLRGMISQHQLQPSELRNAYDFVTNQTAVCSAPDRNFSMAKMKLQQRKKCH